MRGGRQPDDNDARRRITEARHAATPVALVAERRPLLVRHLFAPLDQARAHATRRDLGREAREIAGIPGDHGGGSYAATLMRVLLLVNAMDGQGPNDVVMVRLVATDLAGNEITQINTNTDFFLEARVSDLRGLDNSQAGVFAAYIDVHYTAANLSIANNEFSAVFDGPYTNASQFRDFSTDGEINDLGAFDGTTPLGNDEQRRRWNEVMTREYHNLIHAAEHHRAPERAHPEPDEEREKAQHQDDQELHLAEGQHIAGARQIGDQLQRDQQEAQKAQREPTQRVPAVGAEVETG